MSNDEPLTVFLLLDEMLLVLLSPPLNHLPFVTRVWTRRLPSSSGPHLSAPERGEFSTVKWILGNLPSTGD